MNQDDVFIATTQTALQLEGLSEFHHAVLWAVIIGAILAFLLGFGMGANDVSNAFGTSVGSKAVGLKTAYCMATVFETLGTILVGYNVTDTMRKLVVDINLYANEPKTLLLGEVAILGGGAAWLFIATFFKLPVSTTHSIVGATLGFSIMCKGFQGIVWKKVIEIAISWVSSPLLSGIVSVILYLFVDHLILRQSNSLSSGFKVLPFFYFACLAFNTFVVSYQGSKVLHLSSVPLWFAITLSIIVGIVSGLLFYFVGRPYIIRWMKKNSLTSIVQTSHENDSNTELATASNQRVFNDIELQEKNQPMSINSLSKVNATTSSVNSGNKKRFAIHKLEKHVFPKSSKRFILWLLPDRTRKEDPNTLKLFSFIQVFTACFAGFAHGANDVSNAVAPIAAIYSIYVNMSVDQQGQTPIYVLLYGVLAICVGLWVLGHRVIKTVGQEMSEIHPASGFCIEFGAAVTALVASKLGLPISTTHCLIGSVVCVGTIKSGKGIDWKLFRNVALSWVVTLPISGVISALLMLLFKLTL